MHFLIIGAGSSAGKFITILRNKKHRVSVYQHRPKMEVPEGCKLVESVSDLSSFDGGIVSSPSAFHFEYAKNFIEQKTPVLVEKPITDSVTTAKQLQKLAQKNKSILMVGLNRRYLPIVQTIKKYITSQKIGKVLHAELYNGQYLPTWRPWLDYRTNYSVSYERGGGVALDLIHEIDNALNFFEGISLHPIVSEKLSELEINTEDFVLLQTRSKPFIQVKLDYLHHFKTHYYRIIGSKGSLNCDIINHRFEYCSETGKETVITDEKYFDVKKTFETEIHEFVKMIQSKKIPELTDRALAIDALAIALKARKHVQG